MRAITVAMVVISGAGVLAAIVLMLLAIAYLRGGHPPASGIVVLMILALVLPLSVCSAIVGLKARVDAAGPSPKLFFVMTGVCLAFSVFAATLLVLKFVFRATI